jgi:hypothetical protein
MDRAKVLAPRRIPPLETNCEARPGGGMGSLLHPVELPMQY